jgi:hypothetical protein
VVIGERLELPSQLLNETRTVLIGKPASYGGGEDRYPVLYLLDGDGHFHHTTGLINFLARNQRIPEVLVVAIPNTDRTRDLTPPSQVKEDIDRAPTHGGADTFLRFMSDELMPWVEQNYRTRPYKILVGHSFGGLFAIHTLTTRPGVFDAYVAISPSLQWNDQHLVMQAETFFEATPELDADLFMTVGNEGGALLGGVRKLSGVLDEKAPRGFRWDFNLLGQESHGSVPYRSTNLGLETIFADWYLSDAMAMFEQGGIEAIDKFYEKSGTRYGYERKTPGNVVGDLSFRLIQADRLGEASSLLLRDPAAYPPPSNLLDMVASGYRKNGHDERASEHYRRSLEAHPGNENARKALTEMGVDFAALVPQVDVAPEVLASYVGTYELPPSTVLSVVVENGQLVREINGGNPVDLFPMSEATFYRMNSDILLTFNVDEADEVESLTVDQGWVGQRRAQKID